LPQCVSNAFVSLRGGAADHGDRLAAALAI
jgi:hypothetical protein